MNNHLAILKKQYIDAILAGTKTIESRLYKGPFPPFGMIEIGDKLFLKASSGQVCATARVSAVKSFENLTPAKVADLKMHYNSKILGDNEYWQMKSDSKFAIFAWLSDIKPLEPIRINKKDWRAWVVLKPGKDFGLIKPHLDP
ncbi:MAG: ASCH domain-containing protein [Anaerohalosphaeraceae bacterium]|nr:ASCH domain-containing protein [Anaerohalosphaeraceae bacterium]